MYFKKYILASAKMVLKIIYTVPNTLRFLPAII